jgi:hypothetical protein
MKSCGWRAGSDRGFRLGMYAMRKEVMDWATHQDGVRQIAVSRCLPLPV